MGAVDKVVFPLVTPAGRPAGTLSIATLPAARTVHGQPALLLLRDGDEPSELERVQLLEGCEYLFWIDGCEGASTDKDDLFFPDDVRGTRGRVRTRQETGCVPLVVSLDGVPMLPVAFEVRSSKLGYVDDFRRMLSDISDVATGLVLERFAPAEQRLKLDNAKDADTLYQRFLFLRGVLRSDRMQAALRRIFAQPHVQWERFDEVRTPSLGVRGGGDLARRLSSPGARAAWTASPHPAFRTIPLRMPATRTEESLDNVPNRFLRFALEEWHDLVMQIQDALNTQIARAKGATTAPIRRGLREVSALREELELALREPMLGDVGRLAEFPSANQVLLKKEGYREVLNAYSLVRLGASLTWQGGEDVFSGGSRDVAALYEYWVFLELAKIVSSLCDSTLDLTSLVTETASGLSLVLRRRTSHGVGGEFIRRGRRFRVELCFNQQFSPSSEGTWTKTMRPDCSLHIVPLGPRESDDVWMHFDAKYRVAHVSEVVGKAEEPALVAKNADLYKMHTYRDAILNAVGAYVVFPGDGALTKEQYDEVLPGLGAFPLKPTASGTEGAAVIKVFLENAFDHVATQTTNHERMRYWRRRANELPGSTSTTAASALLDKPPADTLVLLGFVKSLEHLEWVRATGLYNLRADTGRRGSVGVAGRELGAEFVVAYNRTSAIFELFRVVDSPQVRTASDLISLGYPNPSGSTYLCLPIEAVHPPSWFRGAADRLTAATRRGGAPEAVTWRNVADAAAMRHT